MTSPLISVVIPAYNQADFLDQTIESVLAQTLCDYEIIVVDDGSTDHTAAVVGEYGDAVRYVWQENGGLAAARNTGICSATGRYIALLDSDDWWEPTFLAELIALTEREPSAVVWYSGTRYVDEAGRALPQTPNVRVVPPAACRDAFLRGNFIVPSATLLVRETLLEVGLFDVDYRRLQDWELWVRLVLKGYTLAGVAKPLVNYRIHGKSLSTDPSGGQRAAMALAVKHFGVDDGNWVDASAEKRIMYSGVYVYHAITSALIRAGDWQQCASWLDKAMQLDPALANDPSIFYELALGSQPFGWRGTPHQLTLADNFSSLARLVNGLAQSTNHPRRLRATAWLNAGWVAYNVGSYQLWRKAWVRVMRHEPLRLLNRTTLRTVIIAIYRAMKSNAGPKRPQPTTLHTQH